MKPPRFLVLALLLAAGIAPAAELNQDLFSGVDAIKARAAAEAAQRAARTGVGAVPAPQGPAAGGTKPKVDLLPQFANPSTRDQCRIGACHAFGSVAVIEAAYWRKYKEHIWISEQDVFLGRTVLTGDIYRAFCSSGKCSMSEGNDVAGDIRWVFDKGALTGGSYAVFADKYVRYRDAEIKTMEGIQKNYEKMGWLEKLLYDPRAHWKELSTSDSSKKILGQLLQGKSGKEADERAALKTKLNGFTLRSQGYDFKAEYKSLAPADCLAKGAAQFAALKSELNAQRPVAVSMSLSGLPAWGQTDATRDAYHAFMIVGYEESPSGTLFRTRNSWGGDNPDVKATESCRVYAIDSVIAPGETATF